MANRKGCTPQTSPWQGIAAQRSAGKRQNPMKAKIYVLSTVLADENGPAMPAVSSPGTETSLGGRRHSSSDGSACAGSDFSISRRSPGRRLSGMGYRIDCASDRGRPKPRCAHGSRTREWMSLSR